MFPVLRKALRAVTLLVSSLLCGTMIMSSFVEFNSSQPSPTQSAGGMLNRSGMLLAKNVILEPSLYTCQSKARNQSTYLAYIIVKTFAVSSGEYYQRRMFTRLSWAQEARVLGIPVIYAIGNTQDPQIQNELKEESRIYNDILQFDYIDAYYNMSIKTTGILNWFTERGCSTTSPYLIVVDDDVLVNMPTLFEMISNNTFQVNTIYGFFLKGSVPNPIGKWAVSLEDFPNATFPDFVAGAFVVYSSPIIRGIVDKLFFMINRNEPILFLDDVLINGIVAGKVGVKHAQMTGLVNCGFIDLSSYVIITECSNKRRFYVWSKYLLSRTGQDTFEMDRLIQTTNYVPPPGEFKQTRNGTIFATESFFNGKFWLFISFAIVVILIMKISDLSRTSTNSKRSSSSVMQTKTTIDGGL